MFELQDGFLLGFLSPYLSEIHCPIFNAVNPKSQKNDIPSVLIVQDGLNEKSDIFSAIFNNSGRFYGRLDHMLRPNRKGALNALPARLSWPGGQRSDVVDWLIS